MSDEEEYVCTMDPKCLWNPADSEIRTTNMDRLRKKIEGKYDVKLNSYKEFHSWSVQNYPSFWHEFWKFAEIKSSKLYDEVVDKSKGIAEIPEWFPGSRLNYAENLLRFRDDRVAIYATTEGCKEIRQRTFAELYEDVRLLVAAMKSIGIEKGDRVVGYIPNGIEAVEAMLATASIGAIWSSASPDFGVSGVLDRFAQIQPKLIFSVNAVPYNGKIHNHLDKLEQVVQGLPDLKKVIVAPHVEAPIDLSKMPNACLLSDFLELGKREDGSVPELEFEQLPSSHPLFIMYSSGTTGVPKCMVHSAGGTLLKHLEEHILQSNMTKDDILMYFTTTGWMMWNWYVTALAIGSAIVCYDGSPLVPHLNVLWDLVDRVKITILGTSAKWLSVLQERDVRPKETHSLKTLHTILSTGSPLKPQCFDYVYKDIKSDLLLGSITGGTDIIACFAGSNWTVPVYRGEIQSCHLGIGLESWSEEGKPVYGESGELVITKPFPSMPTHFWNDADGSKYHSAYFDKFDGVWSHGDFCLINPNTGGIWMLGRSDGTLNPGGVRFGSAEIYHVVESFKEIQDSLCVGQRSKDRSEERVVLFLQMAANCQFNADLVKQVQASIRKQLSARHVPSVILETKGIPYTLSGKKVEIAVKKILSGDKVKVRSSYANPDSLDLYENVLELQGY